jgi:hypothetical protein
MRAARRSRTVLLLTLMGVLCLALGSSTAWATDALLTGGEGSVWSVSDDIVTTNGQPSGGTCVFQSGTPGAGAGTPDAMIPGQPDAFDGATMAWVIGTQIGGVGVFSPSEANFAPVAIPGGPTAQMNFRALSTQSTLRVLLRLTNPTGSTITVPVEYVNNFGSDTFTQVIASSTGDLGYGLGDRWIVTDDEYPTESDPANTSVFYGPSTPAEVPVSVSAMVFNCGAPQGSLERFVLEIEPGATETLMFFQQLNPTSAEAAADAPQFDTTPPPGHPLTEGMTPADFATIVNWNYGAAPPPECSDGVDNDGDGRIDHPADRQCESPSDPSEDPQCSDSLDNDADGDVDSPADAGCRSARDNSESPNPQCSDAVDNDGDSKTDYPDDPGCRSRTDNSESPNPQCSDGADNDGDGRTDYRDDPGCRSARDNTEDSDSPPTAT